MGKSKYLFLIALVVVIVAVSGCTSSDTTSTDDTSSNETSTDETSNSQSSNTNPNVVVKVTSDDSWSGSIYDDSGSRSVEGTGNKEFDLGSNPGIVSVTFQKSGSSGSLTVEIIKNGEIVKSQTTTAEYGVVSVSETFY